MRYHIRYSYEGLSVPRQDKEEVTRSNCPLSFAIAECLGAMRYALDNCANQFSSEVRDSGDNVVFHADYHCQPTLPVNLEVEEGERWDTASM